MDLYVIAVIIFFSTCIQEAQSYADENSLLFMETSAKTAMNVNETFLAIGESDWLLIQMPTGWTLQSLVQKISVHTNVEVASGFQSVDLGFFVFP